MNWTMILKSLLMLVLNDKVAKRLDKKIDIAIAPFHDQFKKEQGMLKKDFLERKS